MSDRPSDSVDDLLALDSLTEASLKELLDERFDAEAIAQMVEQLDLSQKLTKALGDVRSQSSRHGGVLDSIRAEIRELVMDVALVKRALVSLGQIGVMERRKIEKELIRELFPPTQSREGTGEMVSPPGPRTPPKLVDCESRLHLCKAACCRIFNVNLTPQEVHDDLYDWDPRRPYALQKNRQGCIHIKAGGCACSMYDHRPRVCQGYSCENDSRIWADFKNKVINPNLKQRLDTLEVTTTYSQAKSRENASGSGSTSNVPSSEHPSESSVTSSTDVLHLTAPPAEGGNSQTDVAARDGSKLIKRVPPPDFNDLRELMVPLPKKIFTPRPRVRILSAAVD